MTLSELYDKIGGDFADVTARFGTEARIERFLGLFLKDPSYDELKNAVAASDWETAFRAAHTMKGTSGNMSLTRLQRSASELTEHLRGGKPLTERSLYDAVCADYDMVLEELHKFMDSKA